AAAAAVSPFAARFRNSFSRIRSLSRRAQRSSLSHVPEEDSRCPSATARTAVTTTMQPPGHGSALASLDPHPSVDQAEEEASSDTRDDGSDEGGSASEDDYVDEEEDKGKLQQQEA
ncbi:hypothetical protein Agub_g1719, partial [Astrephomene gubernaculifera]